MNEPAWAATVANLIRTNLSAVGKGLLLWEGARLPYAYEVRGYSGAAGADLLVSHSAPIPYETDLLVAERQSGDVIVPRVVIELKLAKISTHDAITYSQKAATHKSVHPYLRYGILLGQRKHFPLPGRLFRHGAYFDFMLSWVSNKPNEIELADFLAILNAEVEASRCLEEMYFATRSPRRVHYAVLHRRLVVK